MNRRSLLRLIGLAPVAAPLAAAAMNAAPARGARWVAGVDITRHGATVVALDLSTRAVGVAVGAVSAPPSSFAIGGGS